MDINKKPSTCRNRLRDEGKAYPRSGCEYCGNGGIMGCPYEKVDLSGNLIDPIEAVQEAAYRMRKAVSKVLANGGTDYMEWFDDLVEAQRDLATAQRNSGFVAKR